MKRNNLIKILSSILAVILLTGLIVACDDNNSDEEEEPGCDYTADVSELQTKSHAMNEAIEQVVCYNKAELTREQLAVCVSNFENIQTRYSKKLICEQDGKNYYYPAFVLESDYNPKDITENTRYIIKPLAKDENGIYKGVVVTAYQAEIKPPTELEQKVQEMNQKIRSFEGSGYTLEEMQQRVAEFQSFASAYSGQVFYVDEKGNEHHYPNFYCNVNYTDFETGELYYKAETTRFRITHNRYALNADGIYTGLTVHLYETNPEVLEIGLL